MSSLTAMRKIWLSILALFAGTVAATTAAHGAPEPGAAADMLGQALRSNVEWVGDGVGTMHEDWTVMASAGAGAVSKEVKEKLDDLGKRLKRIVGEDGLEEQVKEARDDAHDAKKKIEELSLDNAEDVDDLKEMILDAEFESFQKELHEILDEREIELKEQLKGETGKDLGDEIGEKTVEAVKESGLSRSNTSPTPEVDLKGERLKDITNVASSGDALTDPDYRPDISGLQLRTPRILDLLTVFATDSDAVEYVLQSAETDNATPQTGQGSALAKTDMEFELKSEVIETIGHIAKASVQILDDAPRLRDFAQTRMRQLLELELEDQVLLGDGTGNNLNGLVPRSSAYDSNLESAVIQDGRTASDLDKLRVAILQVQRSNFQPTGIIMSPLNWAAIELEQTDDGAYQFVNPQTQTSPRLWGLPVVATNALPEGEAHVGNYQMAATLFDRMETTIQVSTENADDFEKLMATFRAYARLALGVEYPDALVHLDSMNATSPSAGS